MNLVILCLDPQKNPAQALQILSMINSEQEIRSPVSYLNVKVQILLFLSQAFLKMAPANCSLALVVNYSLILNILNISEE